MFPDHYREHNEFESISLSSFDPEIMNIICFIFCGFNLFVGIPSDSVGAGMTCLVGTGIHSPSLHSLVLLLRPRSVSEPRFD